MTSDESLMLQFQSGSREPFEELFARYREPVYGFFRRRVASAGVAEELAQETWVAVLKATVRYEPRAPFRSYLYGIAFRLMLAERRKNGTRNALGAAEKSAVISPAIEAGYWIKEALGKLDPTEREIIMLREYEQLSYDEIAKVLHIPLNTVRSRLFRTRLTMKQLLEPSADVLTARGRS